MKGLIQRVSRAQVTVDGEVIAGIETGLLLLLGVEQGDTRGVAEALARKILGYRVFPDVQDRMNLSVADSGGSLLVVPQFTLAADTGSGTRPGFSRAAPPDLAKLLVDYFITVCREQLGSPRVAEGRFGANMQVALVNDGPVTFLLKVEPEGAGAG